MPVNIIIGGDLVPTPSNYIFFEKKDIRHLLGENLSDLLAKSDFTIFNLEAPIVDGDSPIEKCGPNLRIQPSVMSGLQMLNPHFFTLANNHILDQGSRGLESTINELSRKGINYAGVGKNLKEASHPYIYEKNGLKIGIYCCAEREFSIATEERAGVNPFDPLESIDHIQKLKTECDYVIVLYHGGKEHYRYPSPYLQKVCHKIVEKGADLVVCQHSHCIGCEEKWQKGTIVYGQGNFLFDDCDNEFWNTSLLINFSIDSRTKSEISYIPLQKQTNRVRLAEESSNEILNDFYIRSKQILNKNFVNDKYGAFAKEMEMNYLYAFSGSIAKNIFFRGINKLTGYRFGRFFLKRRYKRNHKLALINFVECEAHRELLLRGLKEE